VELHAGNTQAEPLNFDSGVEGLFRAHYREIVRTVLAVVHRLPVAEEVAQDAFEVASREWRKVGRLDRPDLWVRRVALNKAISVMRKTAREGLVAMPSEDRPDETAWSEESSDLLAAIRRLPTRQVEVVVLIYFGRLRTAETARALEISESSVRTHHARALETLASLLGEIDPEPNEA
jgi:RNA polymerase sigma factor (sigma-70 family)